MSEFEKVLELLKSKYGWDYFDLLTETGKRLVGDSIKALDEIRCNPIPQKNKWYEFWK